jgi:hypothetical protein
MIGELQEMTRPELTESERQRPFAHYYDQESAPIPQTVLDKIYHNTYTDQQALPFEYINDLLLPGYLPMETGYCRMPDNSFFVAVRTEFRQGTAQMFDWWFDWHAQDPLRYRIWYPECHFDLSIKAAQHTASQQPLGYWYTTHYPVEDIGLGKETLSIHFVPPADFGFDVSRFQEAKIVTAICGLVGSVDKHLKQQAYMCHLVRQFAGGFEMRSRFWIGQDIRLIPFPGSAILEKLVNTSIARWLSLPSETGFAMALHCAQEYNNLANILPELYVQYAEH